MTLNGRNICRDSRLADTEAVHRKICGSRAIFCVRALLVFGALACGGCQTPQPPLPNPPGPKTAVRLAPGDTIKVSYSDESVPDQTQKIRRDGKVSLPLIGQVTAADKRPIDFQMSSSASTKGSLKTAKCWSRWR